MTIELATPAEHAIDVVQPDATLTPEHVLGAAILAAFETVTAKLVARVEALERVTEMQFAKINELDEQLSEDSIESCVESILEELTVNCEVNLGSRGRRGRF